MDDDIVLAVAVFTCLVAANAIVFEAMKNKRVHRRWWVHPVFQNRHIHGYTANLLPIMQEQDPDMYKNFLRMSPDVFQDLHTIIAPEIEKSDSKFRKAIRSITRLQMTLRFLATGEHFSSISFQFRVGRTTTGLIVKETCKAVWMILAKEYVKFPSSTQDWLDISRKFYENWNLPHCLGAIDGKHVRMQRPLKSGSLNFNYKSYFSKVLFAVAGPDYQFIYVDMEHYGSEGDSGILHKSVLGKAMNSGKLSAPRASKLPGCDVVSPYFFIGDHAFPLRSDLMRPYKGKNITDAQKTFNYRLCRARRVVENAFGILANRFRILHRPLAASEETNDFIVLAAIALHNFLISKKCNIYCPDNLCDSEDSTDQQCPIDGLWREDGTATLNLLQHQQIGCTNSTRQAARMRDTLTEYFASDAGHVPWQDTAVQRGYYM